MSYFQVYTKSARRSVPYLCVQLKQTFVALTCTFQVSMLQFPKTDFVVAQMDYMDAAVKVRLPP